MLDTKFICLLFGDGQVDLTGIPDWWWLLLQMICGT